MTRFPSSFQRTMPVKWATKPSHQCVHRLLLVQAPPSRLVLVVPVGAGYAAA